MIIFIIDNEIINYYQKIFRDLIIKTIIIIQYNFHFFR